MSAAAFRLGFVTGATPDKWARTWRERRREPLEVVPVTEDEQEAGLRDGSLDMCLVRLPIDRDGLHCIPLYDEQPVVVSSREHFVAAADGEVELGDLADEQLVIPHRSGWKPTADQLEWPPMDERTAVETVAAGTGIALMPMSVARLHHRKDVVHRVVTDLAPTTVGLAWRTDRDSEQVQAFIGIVRGRTVNSSR
ncbi:MAG TPA: LysR family substrate-binding domain-containing protein [Nocardioides sp.]